MGGAWIMSQHIPNDKPRSDLKNLHELRGKRLVAQERGSCLNIFRITNRGRISNAFTNYEAKDLLRKNLHELRGKRLVAQVSQTRRFANWSGFDALIRVVLAWEERGSPLNIFWITNRGWIIETFTNYEAKDLLRKAWIMSQHIPDDKSRSDLGNLHELRGKRLVAQKPSRITRQKTCCASESNTSVRIVFANRSGFDAPIGVVLAWEEGGSCLNIFRMTNHGQISKTFTNFEAKDLLRNRLGMGGAWIMSQHIPDEKSRSDLKNLHELRGKRLVAQVSQTRRFTLYSRTGVVLILQLDSSWHARSMDHASTYYGRQIAVGSQKSSGITRQKTCCASESNTSVRVVFANRSGFDAPIGVVLAWEERGSCFNIFRTRNRGRISETITNYDRKDLLRKSVDHVSTYSGRQIALGSQKRSRITRQKTCCASENTSVRVVFANRSGFDAPVGFVLEWRSVDHVSTYYGRLIADGSQKPSRIMRQTTCCASESNTSVRVVFANRSGFDAPVGFVLAWRSVDHVSTYYGRQIADGSQKPSRIMRQTTCCARAWILSQHIPDDKSWLDLRNLHELQGKRLVAQVSQTPRFALYSRTVVVLMLQLESSWHGRSVDHVSTYSGRQIAVGSQKPSRITRQKTCCASESNTSVRVVLANQSGFDAPIGFVLAWVERGTCLHIFWMTNRGRISETFTNYEAKDLLRKSVYHVSTYSGRQIAVGSQKPSRITSQRICCASESNTSVVLMLRLESSRNGRSGDHVSTYSG
ncbi:uncharacterized protein G2W53_033650 [Senna tora]|uniref:Uncharacterized protein n=1 Tax=Senna tora TaxID=362788 RepID=A0A834WD08_9FABA|nr:uncharacterized protein G2W53_033650 [Senna tora]